MAKRRERFGAETEAADKKKVTREGLKETLKIFEFVLPYRGTFALGLVMLVLSTGTSLGLLWLFGEIVDAAQGKSSFTINQVTLAIVAILVLQAVFSFFRVYLFSRVSERAMVDVRTATYRKIITLPIFFFEQRRVGELTSRLTSDISQLQDVLSLTLAEFIRQVATLTVGIAVILFISPKLTVFMLATFPVLIVAAMVFGRFIRTLSKKAQDALANANVVVEETLQSINIVKAFTNERFEVGRYSSALQAVIDNALRAARFRGIFVSFIIFALFGGILGVLWFGAGLVAQGEMSIGELTRFVLFTGFIGGAVGGMGDLYAQIQRTIGASERIREILQEPSEVEVQGEPQPIPRIAGDIAFHQVRFAYPSRPDVEVLKGVSLNVPAGRKIALVGYSGAGKSTIVQLLMRYHRPDTGEILIDNQPIESFNLTGLRQNIGVVPQEVILFGGTIAENIAYGKPGAGEAEIREAARKANALDFILSFPDGFQTIVGERGVKLSGGQRQRIAIARAILKDPAILILDEATSSLDAESEKLVQEALDELMQHRTTIIIAHRLATIRKVDTIYVINEGRILESGTHEELAEMEDGLYSSLIKLQFEVERS
ncbi:MAG: ATP-binding cassette domain-containing protein [Ferruginibacter sp.]|nr:ATP-binding cassette domain-containing protein [Cytophagales bacterium]